MYRDPVCGMAVDVEETPWWMEYQGENYYFCSQACLETFEKDPERYLTALTASSDDDE